MELNRSDSSCNLKHKAGVAPYPLLTLFLGFCRFLGFFGLFAFFCGFVFDVKRLNPWE
jgi:hypothetical protein